MPKQNNEPMSVATRLICGNDTADTEVGEQRLGDEAEPLRPPRQRADHRQRRDPEHDPAVVDPAAEARHSRQDITGVVHRHIVTREPSGAASVGAHP